MARTRGNPRITRKHLARAQRDRIMRRWILAGTISVAVAVLGLLLYAFVGYRFINMRQPILSVNGDELTRATFVSRVRILQINTISEIQYAENIMTYLQDPNFTSYYQTRIDQLTENLITPGLQGQQVMQSLIRELIIRQEARRRGIVVTSAEVEALVAEEGFGYYVEGTPTPLPSPTMDATAALISTATATAEGTPVASVTPLPTATAYTEQAYLENYAQQMDFFKSMDILEADYLMFFESSIYSNKLMDILKEDLPTEVDQVWPRHILVATSDEAEDVLERLADGEAWDDLAAELTLDEYTQFYGGDMGWLPEDELGDQYGVEFSSEVFSASIDEIIGPLETTLGWHIVQVQGHEVRTLNETQYEQRVQNALETLVTGLTNEAEIVVDEQWTEFIPEPDILIDALYQ
jgi:parvulin-like peptidyl-prolyl isomerase